MEKTTKLGRLNSGIEMMDANQISTYYIEKETVKNALSDFTPDNIGNISDIKQILCALSTWNSLMSN